MGGRFDNHEFRGILAKDGTTFEPSAPYTQHQNGVSERRIRFIVDMVRCMLHDAKLGKEFWAEAATTAVYIINRLPTSALNSKTPFEAWYGQPPMLQHIGIFGCTAYAHIPKKKRAKLDSKTQKCIFLGYVRTSTKIWRLWDRIGRRVFKSANVVFDESSDTQTGIPADSQITEVDNDPAVDNNPEVDNDPAIDNNLEVEVDPMIEIIEDDSPCVNIDPPCEPVKPRIQLGEEIVDEAIQSTVVARKSHNTTGYDDSSEGILRCNHTLKSQFRKSLSNHNFTTVVPYDATIEASRGEPSSHQEALEDPDSER